MNASWDAQDENKGFYCEAKGKTKALKLLLFLRKWKFHQLLISIGVSVTWWTAIKRKLWNDYCSLARDILQMGKSIAAKFYNAIIKQVKPDSNALGTEWIYCPINISIRFGFSFLLSLAPLRNLDPLCIENLSWFLVEALLKSFPAKSNVFILSYYSLFDFWVKNKYQFTTCNQFYFNWGPWCSIILFVIQYLTA